ncbi:glycosyltransferase [Fundidesulfovibrio soli]|uniref:glycosyltransferase n=1 Tax=Fundidesulfovibrio soli TaxID=2922716 RepID=UPI001FAFBDAC|nr:glycosyltransferase [Fundidesulfovibrio soli]
MKRPVLGMILKGYPRISETFISNEIELLEAEGFNIRILSMRHPREDFTHESVKRIKAPRHYLPETILGNVGRLLAANLLCALRSPARYAGAFVEMLRRIAHTRKATTAKHLLQAGYLAARVLPGSGVTHLHAHFAHSPTSVAVFTSLLTGLPYSFTAHAKDIYTQDPARLAEKIAGARFVATCTGYNKEYLEKLNPSGTPIHRVYHGIDVRLFSPVAHRHANGETFEILTVARLTPKKGLPTVLRAVAELVRRGHPVRHAIIGTGEEKEALQALAGELGISDAVEWLGVQAHEVVVERMSRADLFLLGCEVSGNGDRDGIPNVLVEAMAMGLPVAATAVSAIPELIVDGEHGLLVPPRDHLALAGAAERLLTDEALRARVIPAALDQVRSNFDNRRLVGELAAIFRAAMS